MPRYIDAELLEKWMKRDEWDTPDERWRPESEFGRMIDSIPTADVEEVRHGEWVPKSSSKADCSRCGRGCADIWYTSNGTRFRIRGEEANICYVCGAKMNWKKGEKEDGKSER